MQASEYGSIVYKVEDDRLKPRCRNCLLHLPPKYGSSPLGAPLLIGLHGKDQPPAEFESHSQFSDPNINPGAIAVYPEGVNLQWLGDPAAPPREEVDDILFINVLLDSLQRDYDVDKSRTGVIGFSNGGGLAALLAADTDTSQRFSSFAISSGAFYKDSALKEPLFSRISPGRIPVPIIEFHGDSDPVIHYEGKTTPDGETYPLLEFFDIWAKQNRCHPTPKVRKLYDGKVIRYIWVNAEEEEVLVHYRICGFGHGWPTTRALDNEEQRHGPTCFNATPIVADFCRRFARYG